MLLLKSSFDLAITVVVNREQVKGQSDGINTSVPLA